MFICYFFSIFLPFICVFLTYTHYYIYLFVFGCVGSLLLHVGFLQLQNADFSLWWLLLLQNTGSRQAGFSSRYTGAHQLWLSGPRACRMQQLRFVALEHRFGRCGARAYLLRGMRDLPGPGIKPLCPLRWQVNSYLLHHQGSPSLPFLYLVYVYALPIF